VVNEEQDGAQAYPKAASFGDGGFVLVWQCPNIDGNGSGVAARRHLAGGMPADSEFQVNTHVDSHQEQPGVAAHGNGSFAVIWQSKDQDGDGHGIFARLFAAGGAALTGELSVNTQVSGDQQYPVLAPLRTGGYAAAWSGEGDGDSSGIYVRPVSSLGSFPAGGAIRVNSWTDGEQTAPDLAVVETGNVAVVWASKDVDGSSWGIAGRLISPDGSPVADEFQVNLHGDGEQSNPAVTALAGGGFVVCWDGSLANGDGHGVAARLFSNDGTASTQDVAINSTESGNQVMPVPVALSDGRLVVVWQGSGQDGNGEGIFFRILGAELSPTSGEIPANFQYDGNQKYPDGIGLVDGGFVLTWTSDKLDDNSTAVAAGLFDSKGGVLAP